MAMCENCRAYNARVIIVGGDKEERYVLCPRCLKILEDLNREYEEITSREYTDDIFLIR